MNNQKKLLVYMPLNFLIRTCVNVSELEKKKVSFKGNVLISHLVHSAFWDDCSEVVKLSFVRNVKSFVAFGYKIRFWYTKNIPAILLLHLLKIIDQKEKKWTVPKYNVLELTIYFLVYDISAKQKTRSHISSLCSLDNCLRFGK